MLNTFEELCTYVYVIVNNTYVQLAPLLKRPGPKCSDSELITMSIVGECKEWDMETELLSNMKAYKDMFPVTPTQSRFNRRRRNLMHVTNTIRQVTLTQLDLPQDNQTVIDSLPVPVVKFHLSPGSTGDWGAYGAGYGKVSSKKETIYGFKLHLLVTLGGLILDFELAPASASDLAVGIEMLSQHTDLDVLGDKGYISADKAAELLTHNRTRLSTLLRRNQKLQLPRETRRHF